MIEITGTFDIECADWDRFKVSATYDGRETTIHETRASLVDHLLAKGGTWWAHCGGQYDGLAVADELDQRGVTCQIDYPRSRMTRLVAGRTTIRDSWGLLPFSLEVIADLANEACPKLPWTCTCRLRCGGYCRIAERPARELHEYVAADCRVLFRGLCALVDFADAHRIELKGTIGGSAWATAQRDLGLLDAMMPPSMWRRVQQADKGGRAVLCRPIAPGPGTHRDISSAYPAALARVSLPTGVPRELGAKNATTAFLRSQPGVYQAVVDIPPSFLPPLPWRHANRITYPHGVISGTWPLPELQAAVDRGVKVIRVESAVAWRRERVIFASLVAHWYAIRKRYGKQAPFGKWMRELANSLTGKFGEQPWRRTIRMHPDRDSIVVCQRTGVCRHGCTGACLSWDQLDKWGAIWAQPYYRSAPSGHLQWSAYLKAATRIAWLTEAERHGDKLVSGNTDSIWTTARVRSQPEGLALGAWETKNTWTEWEARSPSCYRFRDGDTQEIRIRAAGAGHMTDAEWSAGRLDRSRGVQTLLDAARGGNGLFHRRVQRWTLPGREDTEWFGDRRLDASGVITHPVDADELRARHARRQLRHA